MDMKDNAAPIRWLLLIHQLPAKPAYVRVKIGRKLQSLGAVPIKNAVHAMPHSADAAEAYKGLTREITQAGGEVLVCDAALIDGLTDIGVRALFDAARDADYEVIVQEGRALLASGEVTEAEVKRLAKRLGETVAIDFFAAHGRQDADSVLADVERLLLRHPDVRRPTEPPKVRLADLRGRVWVTRKHIHVDRIASAWLIRRFIDPNGVFKFVDGKNYKPKLRELRFDMANAEFTHEGNDCTFETLVRRTDLGADQGLRAIAEIIHDLDIEDNKYNRPETMGLSAMMSGICASANRDEERLSLGSSTLDQFYAHFRKE